VPQGVHVGLSLLCQLHCMGGVFLLTLPPRADLALTFSSRHLRTPSTVAGRAQHHDQDPQVRGTTRPARALLPIDLCVCTRVCAVNCLRGDTLMPVRTAVALSARPFCMRFARLLGSLLVLPRHMCTHQSPLCTFPAIVLLAAVCFAWFSPPRHYRVFLPCPAHAVGDG
jgi:hypothetical protein